MLRSILGSFANGLCGALSSVARLGLHFVSADSNERQAQEQLQGEFQRMPVAEANETQGSWESNRQRLRKQVLSRDPRGFLTWDVIRATMFPPPYATFARTELNFLKRHEWTFWRSILRERRAGLPWPCLFYPLSSSNAIHQAYHLCRFEIEMGVKVRDFGAIVEFGGGYGCLCRIAHGAGFSGRYAIFDLPEQSALQRYYLRAVGVSDVQTVSAMPALRMFVETSRTPRLFLATWSLSESPVELRKQVANVIRGFDAFLIAYQSKFAGVDNGLFFADWQSWFPEVTWRSFAIEQMPESTYLFGVRILHTGLECAAEPK